MTEEWKVLKEWNGVTTKASTHITGDKLYISNTGKVRLNDIELTLDKGLYINNGGEITIVGFGWPYRNMHRTIYQLFNGNLKKGCGWNIHHIDGNHYNNNLDNLLLLTAFEHGRIHAEHDLDWGDKRTNEWIELQKSKADDVIKLTKEWYKSRVNDYLNNVYKQQIELNKQIREEERAARKKEKELQLQQEINTKLESGKYKYNSRGVLVPTTTAKKGYITPAETKKKQSVGVKRAWDEGRLTADKCNSIKGKKRYFDTKTNKFYYK